MKYFLSLIVFVWLAFSSCKKTIDLYPESNLNTGTYYSNYDEVKAAVNGVYNHMQNPLYREWQLTELRSDNARQGVPGSTNSFNRDLSDLDMFIPATTNAGLYNYWLDTYNNIRNANLILSKLGVTYEVSSGTINLGNIDIPISETDRKEFAGEALFIRAYHYFNLVRLFGGVFLIHEPISAAESKTINRSTVADIYKFIEADLNAAKSYLSNLTYSQINQATNAFYVGRANAWAAKALLAKVYLTENKKAESITLLQDVISNSGYSLQTNYANVFSITNELNSEILFAVRYKSGGLGLGSSFGNDFGPLGSGSAVINGSGQGWNTPTTELDTALVAGDARRNVNIAFFTAGTGADIYVKKYLFPVTLTNDGESDWPILRFADVLLMMAEAKGNSTESVGYINQVRTRAGLSPLTNITDVASFEQALSNERRLEFAFENQRWFDLVRFNTTLSTITAQQVMKAHFAHEYDAHYSHYTAPTPTIDGLQANVTADRLLLPIPQHEIDTNTQLEIQQNPGY